ncbi:MAG TPA: hypothetical protein VE988_02585 [Gemmataceae bacterium]|nr:hypothetical protein [Gemmataceae bacterium]
MVHVVSGILLALVQAPQPAKTAPIPPEGVHAITGHVVSVATGVLTIQVESSGEEMKLTTDFNSSYMLVDKTGTKLTPKKSSAMALTKGQLVHLLVYSDGKTVTVLQGTVEGKGIPAVAEKSPKTPDKTPKTEDKAKVEEKTKAEEKGVNAVGTLVTKLGGKYRHLDWAKGKNQYEIDLSGVKLTDADLAPLANAKDILWLKLNSTAVTDAVVPHIAAMTGLEEIDLSGTKITDAGLEKLAAGAKALKGLKLAFTAITDKGLATLGKIDGVRSLDLTGTTVSDDGVEALLKLPLLDSVYVAKTKITDKGAQKLIDPAKVHLRLCRFAAGDKGQFQVHEEFSKGKVVRKDLLIGGVTYGFQFEATDSKLWGNNSRTPTAYYHMDGPLGQVLGKFNPADIKPLGPLASLLAPAWPEPAIGVLRLTTGSVAAYAKKGTRIDFYNNTPEIDAFSMQSKSQPRQFTYLADATARGSVVKMINGDERSMLAKTGPKGTYSVLIVEATKNGLADINTNFFTKEALKEFMDSTNEKGLLCFHVTHRDYNLTAPLADAAKDLGYAVKHCSGAWGDDNPALYSSEWVVIARKASYLDHLKDTKYNTWTVPTASGKHLWKDGGKVDVESLRK